MLPAIVRNQLVSALLDVPKIASRNRRDELLSNLPPNLVDGLNRDESPRTDWNLIISQLDRLGRLVDTGERPLLVVAQMALPYVEGTEAGRRLVKVIEALEEHYGSGEPQGRTAAPSATTSEPTPASNLEAIISGEERVSYEFVDRALAAAASVARLMVPRLLGGEWVGPPALGTAWVVAPGLLLTNYHVVAARFEEEAAATDDECRVQAAKARAWFDYHTEGGSRDEREIAELVCANAELDVAVLRFEGGADRKPLSIVREPPFLAKGDRLNIVQHPRGGPLKYAIRSNHYIGIAGSEQPHLLRYLTDTESGSSGSPVFDDGWKVIAIHRAWTSVPAQRHQGKNVYVNNEGVAIHDVLKKLPEAVRAELMTGQGWRGHAARA